MIIKIDASQLEWRSYLFWSQDPVGIAEIEAEVDVHSENQLIFNLPTRVVAKRFLFRWIYWGPAYAYASDNEYRHVSTSVAFWQDIIDKANEKYNVLYEFQKNLIDVASSGGIIACPSGREFSFEPYQDRSGGFVYNVSEIVNRPNQGFAADLMVLARIALRARLQKMPEYAEGRILLINTVHDDIQLDVDNDPKLLYNVCITCEDSFADIPKNYEKVYKRPYNVPMAGEAAFGPNLLKLQKFKRELGEKQFYDN